MSPKEMWGLLFWGIRKNIEKAKKTEKLRLEEAPAKEFPICPEREQEILKSIMRYMARGCLYPNVA
jgi:hypothetical protein